MYSDYSTQSGKNMVTSLLVKPIALIEVKQIDQDEGKGRRASCF